MILNLQTNCQKSKGGTYMKNKKRFQSILCVLAMILSVGGFVGVAKAATIPLNVTASNVSGMTSKDPYSRKEAKSDSEQRFYITLTSLTNGPSMNFTSYNDARERVSQYEVLNISKSELNNTKRAKYNVTALAGAKYYVYATAPRYFGNVHAVGRYCP